MDVTKAIHERRAYRSLDPFEVTEGLARDLAGHAQLAPSCNNNQPGRFVFVWDKAVLEALKPAFSKGNAWCHAASMVVAVCAEKEADCVIRDREYYLFDTGMQTALLILRATELGLVAHPVAGYNPDVVREVLGIPAGVAVITLVLAGKHSAAVSPLLSEKQVELEKTRPERLPLEQVAFLNRWKAGSG
ncbi:nitroreductase [candidate division WOR-3 bacterium]|nr:nitroreductase [candidate division WOR-3 bacterium]